MRRRALLAAPALIALAPPGAWAQAWPTRSVRMVVGFPPGGAVDIAARLVAELLTPRLGQPVVVENRPGGSGTIGATAVAQAAPDGHTLGAVAVNSLSIHPYLFALLPYDPERDLLPVSLAREAPLVLVVPAAHVPTRDVSELVAWAGRRRGGVSFGSSGIGTTVHLSGELFCKSAPKGDPGSIPTQGIEAVQYCEWQTGPDRRRSGPTSASNFPALSER